MIDNHAMISYILHVLLWRTATNRKYTFSTTTGGYLAKNVSLEASYGCVKAATMTPCDISEELFDAGFDCMWNRAPGRLTWNLQNHLFKKGKWSKPNLQGTMFHVNLQGCMHMIHVSRFHISTVLPFCARVGWTCFSMVQKTMSQGHTMQLIIPYASFGPLGLFQVFWFAYIVGQHIITGHWNSLKHWRWIERYPCVSVSSAQKILLVQFVTYILHFSV